MSDFLFSTRRQEAGTLRRHLERFLAPVTAELTEHHGPWGSLAVARAPHDPPLVLEDETVLTVLAGDPIIRSPGASVGIVDGGPRRRALHDLLAARGPVAWDDHLDGHFAALAIDKRSGDGLLLTDRFAFVPAFHTSARDAEGNWLMVGTHVDATARATRRSGDVDLVSAADLAVNLTCTVPYTLYRGVEQAAAGTARRFTTSGWDGAGRVYWQPVERYEYASSRDAAAALREGFVGDVRAACAGYPCVGLLLSGGEDSRAVLGAVPPETKVRAFIYADWESREVRVARTVAQCYGAELVVGRREPDHYLDGFEVVAGMLGGGHLFMDVHGYGFQDALGIRDLPVVLGGLSSDSLLKSEHAPKHRGPRARIPAASAPPVREELLREVAARRTGFRDHLAELRPNSADEWMHLWPFSMRKHGGNVDGNRRLFRSHEVYHCNAVLQVATGVPREWKARRRLFLAAMRGFFAKAWHVPHSEYRFPYFGSAGNLVLTPGLAVARGLRALATGQVRARHRPWPKWSHVSGSAAMARKWREHPLWQSPVCAIFDPAARPEEVERAVRGWYPLRQLMLLQLAYVSARAGEP